MYPPTTIADMVTNDVAGINHVHVHNSQSAQRWPEEVVDLRRIYQGQVARCSMLA